MSAAPSFASTPKVSAKVLGAFDASFTAPATSSTLVTGAAGGTKVDEIVVQGLATLVADVVNIWLHDGTTFFLYDQFTMETTAASTTVAARRYSKTYSNLVIPSGWTLRANHAVTGNDTSKIAVSCVGADY